MTLIVVVIVLIIIVRILIFEKYEREKVILNMSTEDPVDKETGETQMIETRMNDDQKVLVKVRPTDRDGDPVDVEQPTWEMIEGDTYALLEEVEGDPYSIWVVSSGIPGECVVEFTGDADLGEGFVLISDQARVIIEQSDAQALNIMAEQPVSRFE